MLIVPHPKAKGPEQHNPPKYAAYFFIAKQAIGENEVLGQALANFAANPQSTEQAARLDINTRQEDIAVLAGRVLSAESYELAPPIFYETKLNKLAKATALSENDLALCLIALAQHIADTDKAKPHEDSVQIAKKLAEKEAARLMTEHVIMFYPDLEKFTRPTGTNRRQQMGFQL